MLEKEFQYFRNHQKDLVQQHSGKFVVIKGEEVIGVYETEMQAYTETKKVHEPGTFLIQQCLPDDDASVKVFHRVFVPAGA